MKGIAATVAIIALLAVAGARAEPHLFSRTNMLGRVGEDIVEVEEEGGGAPSEMFLDMVVGRSDEWMTFDELVRAEAEILLAESERAAAAAEEEEVPGLKKGGEKGEEEEEVLLVPEPRFKKQFAASLTMVNNADNAGADADAGAVAKGDGRRRQRTEWFPPKYLSKGKKGCARKENQYCQIGLTCQDFVFTDTDVDYGFSKEDTYNTCVGPAKAGDDCYLSGYSCESGSYCLCKATSQYATPSQCTCMRQAKIGDACDRQADCPTGSLCNKHRNKGSGTCTPLGSVTAGQAAMSPTLCAWGTIFGTNPDRPIVTACLRPNQVDCFSDGDCVPDLTFQSSSALTSDAIFFTCNTVSGKCALAASAPDCQASLDKLAAVDRGKPSATYGETYYGPTVDDFHRHAECMYADHFDAYDTVSKFPYSRTGAASSGSFPMFSTSSWTETTWLAVGDDCPVAQARCPIGTNCADGTCQRRVARDGDCSLNPYCGPGLSCYNSSVCEVPSARGKECHTKTRAGQWSATRTCERGAACFWEQDTHVDGIYSERFGTCRAYATVEKGEVIASGSSSTFCKHPLVPVTRPGGGYECHDISVYSCTGTSIYNDMITCANTLHSYADYLLSTASPDYHDYDDSDYTVEDYFHKEGRLYYNHYEYAQYSLASVVGCERKACTYIGPSCSSEFAARANYLSSATSVNKLKLPSWGKTDCELSNCLYGAAIAKGYITCDLSAAAPAALPSLLALSVLVALGLLL